MTSAFGPQVLPHDSPAIRLLEQNDTGRGVYISHIDRTSVKLKIAVFMIPLLMYTVIAAFMFWRASKNYDVVLALMLNDFYYVETAASRKLKNGFWSWCWRFIVASFDYYMLSILWPLFRTFVTSHLWLRLRYGFRQTEVVFRAPTGREYDNMIALPPAQFQQAWQASLLHATSRQFLMGNTGFNTRSPPWNLCYTASTDAYHLANSGQFDLNNWELSVWQKNEHQQWTVWEAWRHQDPTLSTKALTMIKEKLLVEGREEFVGKWDALLAEQANMASVASEVTPAMQQLVQSVNDLFKEEGLDLGELWLEAISEADRIQNQPASEAPGQLA